MLTADFSQVVAEIDGMIQRIYENGAFMSEVGRMEVKRVQDRIRDTKLDPLGQAWEPWAPSTRSERIHKGNAELGLLLDEGDLLLSIQAEPMTDGVEIGSNLDYAAYLQNGTDKMPARPFLGWEPDSLPVYENLFIRYVETGVL